MSTRARRGKGGIPHDICGGQPVANRDSGLATILYPDDDDIGIMNFAPDLPSSF